MKPSLFLLLGMMLLLSLSGTTRVAAQDSNTPQGPGAGGGGGGHDGRMMLGFLSPAEREKYVAARSKAFADNPKLKADQEALLKDRPGRDASEDDRKAFMGKMMTQMQAVRAAMLKVDPTLQPIFDKIDKHMAEMRAQRQQENPGGGSPSGT